MCGCDANGQEWNVLSAKLKSWLSVYDEPVSSLLNVNQIPDAPLCGGGKLTLALDGDHREVNFHLTKSDFWTVVAHPENLFPKFQVKPAPFCRMSLTVNNSASQADGFRHVQDMSCAEIRSELPLDGGLLQVRSAAIAQQDFAVFELTAQRTVASVTVRLRASNDENNFFIMEGVEDDQTVWLRKEHKSMLTVNAAAALKAFGAENVRIEYDGGIIAAVSFDVQPDRPVQLVLSAKGGKDEYQHLEKALAALASIAPADISNLWKQQVEWWKEFWLKSWIEIHDELIERYYYGAQYVLGCSLDLDARVTPGLAGGWITSPHPLWGGTYTMNYNGEAPFWGLFSSNRGELILPYARVCKDYIPSGRRLARELKTQGIVMPVMIAPWGLADNDDALGQKGNASLAALSLIWHVQFSRDRNFLEQYAYPFIRELTDFWEDNLTMDASGRYVIENSAARERTPGDLNPGNDLGYAWQVLQAAIEFSTELGVDEERRRTWRTLLDRLSDYPVAEVDGNLCFKEAENRKPVSFLGIGDNPVCLDHVYPGGSLDEEAGEKGKIITRNTLRHLISWKQENAFPRIFSQAVRAEWPGEEILQLFKKRISTLDSYPNETVRRNNTLIPNDHSFEGTGCIEFINSMLAHAHGGVLKVFDVWPKERDASFKRLRVRGAFLVNGELKNGHVSGVKVVSEKGGICRMKSCWAGRAISVMQDDAPVAVSLEAGVYSWETVAGGEYQIADGEPVAQEKQNPPVMLVPIIGKEARAPRERCETDLDILLTPEINSTQLQMDIVYADESRRCCTAECRFVSADTQIAAVSPKGTITGSGSGRTCIDVTAKIDGVRLAHSVSVYMLNRPVISGVKGLAVAKNNSPHRPAHTVECILEGDGMTGPDVTDLHRANSYGVGLYSTLGDSENAWIRFDLGAVCTLDEMWIWNYNCPDDNYRVLWWNGGTACGMRDVTVEYSADGEAWEELRTDGYPFRLAKASGKPWMSATNLDGTHRPIRFGGIKTRYVKLTANSVVGTGNWGGKNFGLSQVRFTQFFGEAV